MLDETFRARVLGVVQPRRAFRNPAVDEQIGALAARLAQRGLLHSGAAVWEAGKLASSEMVIRAREWRRAFERVIVDRRVPPSRELAADLKEFLRLLLSDDIRQLTEIFLKHAAAIQQPHADMVTAQTNALAEAAGEIDLFIDRLEAAGRDRAMAEAQRNTTVNVNAPSVVQTGDNSSITVELNLSAAARAAIEAVIARSGDTSPGMSREDIREFTEALRGELDRPEPRTAKLYAALQGLAATVQGIASGGQFYELVRNAITLLGG